MLSSTNGLLSMHEPHDIQKSLAADAKRIRLQVKQWKRSTLAERSGVPESSIKRFENTGEVSLKSFLKIMFCLDMLDRFHELIKIDVEGMRMDDLIRMNKIQGSKRGVK